MQWPRRQVARNSLEASLLLVFSRVLGRGEWLTSMTAGTAAAVLAQGSRRGVSVTNGATGAGISMCAATRISGDQNSASPTAGDDTTLGRTGLGSPRDSEPPSWWNPRDTSWPRGADPADRKPSRQDHPESRSSRAEPRGVDLAGTNLGRAPSVMVGIVRSRGGAKACDSRQDPRPAFKEVTRK